MKNIHVIPTEKPSRLSDCHNNKLHLDDVRYLKSYKNIYITSDEEIKEPCWVYNELSGIGKFVKNEGFNEGVVVVYNNQGVEVAEDLKNIKKIILTTDQDLIVDGVQKIDNDFLQWFVNNSNCEFVETSLEKEYGEYETGGGLSSFRGYKMKYKIIIQKKNFYCGDEVDYGEKCEFQCEGCNDATGVDYGFLPQEKVEHKGNVLTTEEVMKGRSSAYEFIDFEEVINEAAVKWIRQPKLISQKESFIAGVKWAQKELYTKEDMLEAFNAGNKRGHSGYPNTDNWTQPTFEDFISRKKETKTE